MQMHVTLPNPPLLWHDFQTPAAKPNYSVVCSPLQIDTCMFPPWIISHAGEIHEKWRFKTLFQINKSTSYSSHFSMSDWVTQPLRTVNVAHQEKQLPVCFSFFSKVRTTPWTHLYHALSVSPQALPGRTSNFISMWLYPLTGMSVSPATYTQAQGPWIWKVKMSSPNPSPSQSWGFNGPAVSIWHG